MKRSSDWALTFSICLLGTALVAFLNSFFVDATFLGLYGSSGVFFTLAPHRTKNIRWNTYKLISYLLFICAVAVSMFKYLFLEASQL
jgi:hypothetical protein